MQIVLKRIFKKKNLSLRFRSKNFDREQGYHKVYQTKVFNGYEVGIRHEKGQDVEHLFTVKGDNKELVRRRVLQELEQWNMPTEGLFKFKEKQPSLLVIDTYDNSRYTEISEDLIRRIQDNHKGASPEYGDKKGVYKRLTNLTPELLIYINGELQTPRRAV